MKLYFIINEDLNMSAGKIAAQVSHCTVQFVLENQHTKEFADWYNNGKTQTKVVLKGNQKALKELEQQGHIFIKDNGLTEVDAGSLTCVCLGLHNKLGGKLKRLRLL